MIRRLSAATMLSMVLSIVSTGEAQEPTEIGARAQTSTALDLRVPDITELFTEEQIQALLAPTFQEYTEEVEVRGRREPVTPDVWPGIAAPIWAVFNPTQAWRILAPLPPDRSQALALNADITTPYQQPTARTATDL